MKKFAQSRPRRLLTDAGVRRDRLTWRYCEAALRKGDRFFGAVAAGAGVAPIDRPRRTSRCKTFRRGPSSARPAVRIADASMPRSISVRNGTKERREYERVALPAPNGSRCSRVARPAPPARRVFCGAPVLIECYLCRRGRVVSIFSSGASFNEGRKPMPPRLSPARAVARRLGLRYVDQDELTWR